MRAQAHAERAHALLHTRDVADHARLVDQRRGCRYFGQSHGCALNRSLVGCAKSPCEALQPVTMSKDDFAHAVGVSYHSAVMSRYSRGAGGTRPRADAV